MERVIAIKMNLDSGQSVQEADELDKSLGEVGKSLDDINNKAKKKSPFQENLEKLNATVKSGTLDARQLSKAVKDYQTIALNAGRTSPIGKEALAQAATLRDKLVDLDNEVKRLSHDGANLQAALQLGSGIVAGFTAFKGVTAALGVENENLMKVMTQLQGAQAALMAIERLRASLEKESFLMIKAKAIATKVQAIATGELTLATVAQTAILSVWTKVTKVATIVQKAFNLAMKMNPIGLVILAITALIAGFVAFGDAIMSGIRWLAGLKKGVLDLLGPISWLILAYEALFGEIDEGTDAMREAQRKANEEAYKLHKAKIKMLEEERDTQIELLKEIQNRGKVQKQLDDLALLQAKARGDSEKEIFEQTKKQNEATLEMARQEYAAKEEIIRINHEIAKAEYERFKVFLETRALQAGWSEKQIQTDLKRLEEAKAEYLKVEQDKRTQNEITIQTIEAQNEIFLKSRNKQIKEADDELAKQKEKDRKAQEKKDLEYQKLTEDFNKDLTDLRLNNIADANDRELALLQEKFRREREALIDKYGKDTELEKQLMIQQERDLLELEAEFEKSRQEAAKALREAEQALIDAEEEQNKLKFDAKMEEAQAYIDKASLALEVAGAVNELLSVIAEERIAKNDEQRDQELSKLEKQKQKELRVEGLTERDKAIINKKFAEQEFKLKLDTAKKNDEIAKKQFNRDKKLKLASAALDMASAIVKAIAMFGPPPSPMGIAGIAAAGIIGGAQMAIIARQRFEGSAASISPPDITIPSVDDSIGGGSSGSSGGGSGGDDLPGTDTSGLTDPKIQVSIVEIENVKMQVEQIEEISTL